jgi:hypothetical protein
MQRCVAFHRLDAVAMTKCAGIVLLISRMDGAEHVLALSVTPAQWCVFTFGMETTAFPSVAWWATNEK